MNSVIAKHLIKHDVSDKAAAKRISNAGVFNEDSGHLEPVVFDPSWFADETYDAHHQGLPIHLAEWVRNRMKVGDVCFGVRVVDGRMLPFKIKSTIGYRDFQKKFESQDVHDTDTRVDTRPSAERFSACFELLNGNEMIVTPGSIRVKDQHGTDQVSYIECFDTQTGGTTWKLDFETRRTYHRNFFHCPATQGNAIKFIDQMFHEVVRSENPVRLSVRLSAIANSKYNATKEHVRTPPEIVNVFNYVYEVWREYTACREEGVISPSPITKHDPGLSEKLFLNIKRLVFSQTTVHELLKVTEVVKVENVPERQNLYGLLKKPGGELETVKLVAIELYFDQDNQYREIIMGEPSINGWLYPQALEGNFNLRELNRELWVRDWLVKLRHQVHLETGEVSRFEAWSEGKSWVLKSYQLEVVRGLPVGCL